MSTIKQAASDFLACRRIAVTGVSRHPQGEAGNGIYKRLRDRGYEVFAVNPNAEQVEGDACYPDLAAIPGGVDAVVLAGPPRAAEATIRQCVELGVAHAWMHRSFGGGSVDPEAAAYGRDKGITVIEGGCPLMFDPAADMAHKVMKVVFTATGKVPRQV